MSASSPFGLGSRILGAGAALLILFLAVGFALPGTWAAERSALLPQPPEVLYPLLESPQEWRRWTAWPDTGIVAEGPERGVGARLRWKSRELGDGSWEIVEAEPLRRVRYRVEVQGGSMHTEGSLTLQAEGTGTRVSWREEGDFGWNPLMGYWARLMESAQGRELEKALGRLGEAAEGAAAPPAAPADSAAVGASEKDTASAGT